ncbi:Flavohemo protein [Hyaloraphidium curvatum]|nr:Flavohemo protein [Hyaloraphidium curvatum]
MVIKGIRCSEPGCGNFPWFRVVATGNAGYCRAHRRPGTTFRSHCFSFGCRKGGAYGRPGSIDRWCDVHREDDVVVLAERIPILEKGGETLTRAFYGRMFAKDPEVKAYFNPAHQARTLRLLLTAQPRALADSILAFAKNIESLGELKPAIELIAQKHVALDIKRQHYPIVGRNLLAAMEEVLGKDTATPEVIKGWGEAYGFLANVLADREQAIYDELQSQPGGWIGRRAFEVTRKVRKSEFITSISMRPKDGGPLPFHKAGQYLTIYPSESMPSDIPRPIAPRNYSISSPPGSAELRITVKREAGAGGNPPGVFSNWIHDAVKVGDTIELGPPVGNFFLDEEAIHKRPAIFLGAGVGLTPFVPMVHVCNRIAPAQKIYWFYSAGSSDFHPLIEEEVEELAMMNNNVTTVVAYDRAQPNDEPDFYGRFTPRGVLQLAKIRDMRNVDIYVCGPKPFMGKMIGGFLKLGVPKERVHFEFFGPAQSDWQVEAEEVLHIQ